MIMKQDTDKIKQTEEATKEIRTKLKFIKSDKNGALISFISQNPITGRIRGVRQDSRYYKKIVLVDQKIANRILVNVLYDCVLIPMMPQAKKRGATTPFVPGYIAIEAEPVRFQATVTTQYIRGVKYLVEVTFGNKTVRFDPFAGQKETVKSLAACKAFLEKRLDIADLPHVLEDFEMAAINLVELMKQDMRDMHNTRKSNAKAYRGYRY